MLQTIKLNFCACRVSSKVNFKVHTKPVQGHLSTYKTDGDDDAFTSFWVSFCQKETFCNTNTWPRPNSSQTLDNTIPIQTKSTISHPWLRPQSFTFNHAEKPIILNNVYWAVAWVSGTLFHPSSLFNDSPASFIRQQRIIQSVWINFLSLQHRTYLLL